MFTGLIETTSKVEKFSQNNQGAVISFKADFDDVKVGDSICVNGACLSITKFEHGIFSAEIMRETLNLTNLKYLKTDSIINLERAMPANSRFQGHIVTGHVDCIAKVKSIQNDGFSRRIKFNCDNDLIVKKGSICINGVSLTVSDVSLDDFEVSLIPETIKNTNLKDLQLGNEVNIEFDILAKYIAKFANPKKEITMEFLRENGF